MPLPPRRSPELHQDILAFANQVRPTPKMLEKRTQALMRSREVLRKATRRDDVDLHMYGSGATSTRLPLDDLDLVIEVPNMNWAQDREQLVSVFAEALRKEESPSAMLVKGAMLKWTDRRTGIKFDACVNNAAGLRSTALLARAVAETPAIGPLVQVLKAQLLTIGAHKTYNGGVNGYLLANMVRHLLGRKDALAKAIKQEATKARRPPDARSASSEALLQRQHLLLQRRHSGDHDLGVRRAQPRAEVET